ncbi:hypothetical protein ACNF42_07760 [Cuniculiplasma sp. SKW3]|uniref:hypothetical protein n=1 Tax=Cuniculiplasma sp. SKW3 TaxID=3400170 RepID=UPI003FD36683
MSDIFVRAFTGNSKEKHTKEPENHNPNIRLIFDTETTIDQYQNLTFGSCVIQKKISTGIKEKWYLFYGNIPEDKIQILLDYGKKHNIDVMPVREFVDNVFYPYAYKMRCQIIGFNLPFDISRLAINYGIARKSDDAFSFKLSEDKRNPRVRIESIDQKRSFITFTKPLRKKSDKKYGSYKGYFVDLKTFTFALTDRSYSLDSACKDFGASRKMHTEEHGKITEEYIDYNIQDVRSTADLYDKALERYKMFNLNKEPNILYSPASIGKAYLEKMNIKPFLEQNPDFPKEILGYAMSSYYGGRTEIRIRNRPVPITYLDFTSMYPTVYSLLNLDEFLKAKHLKFTSSTESVKEFVKNVSIGDLNKPETWKSPEMHSIAKIKPNEDILPVRMEYSKTAKNIGINYLTSKQELWYTVEDVIASKLLTGKTPEIVEAITFIPQGIQDNLTDVSISDITISSSEDFIRKVIEERIKVKKSNRSDKDQIQLILKIIANATSYGIYIEENTRSLDTAQDVEVNSVDQFTSRVKKIEDNGKYFNPVMASLITGSARLILAMAESIAVKGGYIAYMDTDSIFVSPNKVKGIQDFFRPLNPYAVEVEMFKIEEDDNHNPLDSVMFYGISAKRYCLYRIENGEINILKYSTHGLGHLKDIDGKHIWKSIITKDFKEYSNRIAISQITISKPSILRRFRKMNSSKTIDKQIKPFNFMLIGLEKNDVIPCLPYKKDLAGIQYEKFIDYKTDTISDKLPFSSSEYWHTLEDVLTQYVRHDDHKFDYDDEGIAHRKHIVADRIRYIGKETNNLDETQIIGIEEDDYLEYDDVMEFYNWVLSLKPKAVKDKGISQQALYKIKKKIKNSKYLNLKTKIVKILIEFYKNSKKF